VVVAIVAGTFNSDGVPADWSSTLEEGEIDEGRSFKALISTKEGEGSINPPEISKATNSSLGDT
jgi:hypothetical protein